MRTSLAPIPVCSLLAPLSGPFQALHDLDDAPLAAASAWTMLQLKIPHAKCIARSALSFEGTPKAFSSCDSLYEQARASIAELNGSHLHCDACIYS